MKNTYYLLILTLLGGLGWSCQEERFLDETETTNLNEEVVFSDSAYTTQFLFDIYRDIGFSNSPARFNSGGFFPQTTGGLQTASDESEPRIINAITTDIQFITGTVNPIIISSDPWNIPYRNIRKVNQLLKNLPNAPLNDNLKAQYAAEGRFLRAWYYYLLVQHYGGVPLIGDEIYTAEGEISGARATYEQCVNYIVSECDEAAKVLAIRPRGRDFGRVGAGACMGLKARMLLHAASPLHNGSDFASGDLKEILGYASFDANRWKLAADAAKDLINLEVFKLFNDNSEEPGRGFYSLFIASDAIGNGDPIDQCIILMKMEDKGQGRERLFQPPSRGGTGGGGFPYQETVDAFAMSNGKLITDPSSGYDPQDPYVGRDPRFYNSIIYDQTQLIVPAGSLTPVDIYTGTYQGSAASEDAVFTGTPTGYYTNKMLHREIVANYWIGGPQSRPLIRYAEVLLNFAEATNEFSGPISEVYQAVEAVRERAGLDPFILPAGLSKEAMREVIHHERRVELAFEGFRFWDVRRWMIAEETQANTMTGMEVKRNGEAVSYNKFNVRKHIFRDALYYWPIPQSEVGKSPEMLQNPYY
ncbi:RagB/SusD family nutrient uptake outer membrane protein [Fulvivirga ligni]|uniref:RagB/SusD family nutrient uptake outer membrane protein n=1 Tax=Fulvivirga ligni TaxID=2904246 RepID=UPI001F45694E|nr:RagB/SusD family nutrient uptake outer membrane protein [Fulvivirga ligni]UII19558.1 RagB/SusD family nutrient uptake outer membrane protein [Fulvivirga ligni]